MLSDSTCVANEDKDDDVYKRWVFVISSAGGLALIICVIVTTISSCIGYKVYKRRKKYEVLDPSEGNRNSLNSDHNSDSCCCIT